MLSRRSSAAPATRLTAERQVELVAFAALGACVWVGVLRWGELLELSRFESSPVDWCESNYAVHGSIAEFWNSLSSIPIALVAAVPDLVPLRLWLSDSNKVRVILLLLVLIGLGSTYFHATLSVWGQVADGKREALASEECQLRAIAVLYAHRVTRAALSLSCPRDSPAATLCRDGYRVDRTLRCHHRDAAGPDEAVDR
jgi:hypothetical protein